MMIADTGEVILDRLETVILVLQKVEYGKIQKMAKHIRTDSFQVFTVGNGGSSSTASHLASDLQNIKIPAICLSDNIPRLTATTNDFGWNDVYSPILSSLIVSAFPTVIFFSVHGGSGKVVEGNAWSSNLLNLAKTVKQQGGTVISFIGDTGGKLKTLSDYCIVVDHDHYSIVEGIHSVLAHLLVEEIARLE